MFVCVYDAAAGDFARLLELRMAANPEKLSKAERDVIVEALDTLRKVHQRAANAQKGAIAAAFQAAADSVELLINKVKSHTLEL